MPRRIMFVIIGQLLEPHRAALILDRKLINPLDSGLLSCLPFQQSIIIQT